MNKMTGEKIGETHFDTIGDYFRNKYVAFIIQKWFEVRMKEEGVFQNQLKIWKNRKKKQLGFSDQFEFFVKAIFSDDDSMEEFLAFVKCEYIDNTKVGIKLSREYKNEHFIRTLLSFHEVRRQLKYDQQGGVDCRTIKHIFATSIGDILDGSRNTMVNEDSITPIHESMEQLYEKNISPISAYGHILCYLGEGDSGSFEVQELGNLEYVYHVRKNGLSIDDFEILEVGEEDSIENKYQTYKKYLDFHKNPEKKILSEREEEQYFQLLLDWKNNNTGLSDTETQIRFGRFLEEIISDLHKRLSEKYGVINFKTGEVIYQGEISTTQRQPKIPKGFQIKAVKG